MEIGLPNMEYVENFDLFNYIENEIRKLLEIFAGVITHQDLLNFQYVKNC